MSSRAQLELRAAAVNIDGSLTPNDSKLEGLVVAAEKALVAGAATVKTPPEFAKRGANH